VTPPTAPTRRAYCTIFNALYLVRGLALFRSLVRHEQNFVLHVFAMDELTIGALEGINDPRMHVVRPDEFEDAELRRVRASRSTAEYFWTCTPSIIRYCLDTLHEPECTYVDADVWLLSDPAPLFMEMGESSLLLTEHRYSPQYDQAALSGRYCVQFMRVVGSDEGRRAVQWWRDRCIEWCYARREDGRFGDQKYLDDWPARFSGVHVLSHPGGGLAPWNFSSCHFRRRGAGLEIASDLGDWYPSVFCHFHSMKSYTRESICLASGYRIPSLVRSCLYAPYVRELDAILGELDGVLGPLAARGVAPASSKGGNPLYNLARRVYGFRNTYSIKSMVSHGSSD
jgi:hypothetical protein